MHKKSPYLDLWGMKIITIQPSSCPYLLPWNFKSWKCHPHTMDISPVSLESLMGIWSEANLGPKGYIDSNQTGWMPLLMSLLLVQTLPLSVFRTRTSFDALTQMLGINFSSLHAGHFFMLLLSSADFFSKWVFSENNFKNTIRVSNGLDPDQDPHSVCKGYQQTTKVSAGKGRIKHQICSLCHLTV